jgi:hypothetical protein
MPHWQRQDIRACVVGTPGCEPPHGLEARTGEPVLYKGFFSAFGCPELAPALARLGVETLVVVGLYTHGCVRATVLDAYARGFEVLVADDAIGSTEPLHAELSRDWLNGRAACFLPSAGLLAGDVDSARAELAAPAPVRVADACATAAEAGRRWALVAPAERAALLARWAQALERDADGLSRLLALEIGKPVAEARDELRRTLAHIRLAVKLAHEALEEAPTAGVRVCYRPVGTVALITPWNNPLAIPAGKLAPALACGNGCVWKPSPRAPRCAGELHRALLGAGLPPGLVQLVAGDAETARDIVADPRIDAVALTGSNTAGQRHLRPLRRPPEAIAGRTRRQQCRADSGRLGLRRGRSGPVGPGRVRLRRPALHRTAPAHRPARRPRALHRRLRLRSARLAGG